MSRMLPPGWHRLTVAGRPMTIYSAGPLDPDPRCRHGIPDGPTGCPVCSAWPFRTIARRPDR